MSMGKTNRKYKDRLFRAIFGAEERKHLTIQVYNVLNKSSYKDPQELQLTAIDDVIYMGMKNDVSFLLDQSMNLWEQQSTSNPNMPLRFLLYYAHVMERYVSALDSKANDIYSSALVRIPTPRMVLFYNGLGKVPDYLYLSDAYVDATDPDVQARVRVININSGQDEILEQCRPLRDYTTFVESFRRYREQEGLSDREAASRATDEMPSGDVKDYLIAHRSEVVDMLLTEYDEEKTLRAEFYAGQRAEQENSLRILCRMVADGDATIAAVVRNATPYGIANEADLRKRAAELGIQLPE